MELKIFEKEQFYKIYEDMCLQFPLCELKKIENFEEILKNPYYHLFSIGKENQNCGYFIFFDDKITKTLWMDYFAILRQFHSKGLGSKAFQMLKNYFQDYKGCYLEVEKPESAQSVRRVKFYENLEAKKLNINYFYPNTLGGMPMDLYFMPFNQRQMPTSNEIFHSIKNAFNALHFDIENVDNVYKKIVENSSFL